MSHKSVPDKRILAIMGPCAPHHCPSRVKRPASKHIPQSSPSPSPSLRLGVRGGQSYSPRAATPFPTSVRSFLPQYLFWKGSGGGCSHTSGFTQSGKAEEPLDVGDWEPPERLVHHVGRGAQAAGRGRPSPGAGHPSPRTGRRPRGSVTPGARAQKT